MKEYKLVYLNKHLRWSQEKDLEQAQESINREIEQGWQLQEVVSPNSLMGVLVGVFWREK